jgi:hypothetical protein
MKSEILSFKVKEAEKSLVIDHQSII